MAKIPHKLKYIYWDKIPKIYVGPDEWNELYNSFDLTKRVFATEARAMQCLTKSIYWAHEGYWCVDCGRREIRAMVAGKPTVWAYSEKEISNHAGADAKAEMNQLLQDRYGLKVQACFGAIEDRENIFAIHQISRCVGTAIGSNKLMAGKVLTNCWKADFKSAYPSQTHDLPDWHTARRVNGRVAPTEKEPFAFYLKSHHIAEWGVFDTHVDCKCAIYSDPRWHNFGFANNGERPIHFEDIKDEDEITILCGRSKYDLKFVFDKWFEERHSGDANQNALVKLKMNALIGKLGSVGRYNSDLDAFSHVGRNYGHIRAVVLARHQHQMCKLWNILSLKHYEVLSVLTDSIIWQGGPIAWADPNATTMGSLKLEIADGKCMLGPTNTYWISDGKETIFKHGGVKLTNEQEAAVDSIEKFNDWMQQPRQINLHFDSSTGMVVGDLDSYFNKKLCFGGF